MRWHVELQSSVVVEAATEQEAADLALAKIVGVTPVRVTLDLRDRVGENALEDELGIDIWPAVEELGLKPYGVSIAAGYALFTRDDADAIRAHISKEN